MRTGLWRSQSSREGNRKISSCTPTRVSSLSNVFDDSLNKLTRREAWPGRDNYLNREGFFRRIRKISGEIGKRNMKDNKQEKTMQAPQMRKSYGTWTTEKKTIRYGSGDMSWVWETLGWENPDDQQ